MTNTKYFLHGKLSAKKGQGPTLTALLLKAAAAMPQVKGCVVYAISKDQNDPNAVWVTEIWDSKEDHDNSLKLESVRAIISQAMPVIDGMPQKGQELEVLGGMGIE
jgi:quinol monooxygenase YgiN